MQAIDWNAAYNAIHASPSHGAIVNLAESTSRQLFLQSFLQAALPFWIIAAVGFLVMLPAAGLADPIDSNQPDGLNPALLEAIGQQDDAIRTTIVTRLAVIDGMEDVRVEVNGGLVRLRGQVADDFSRELAETVATGTTDVIRVDNQLVIDTDVAVRLAPVLSLMEDKGRQFLNALPLLIASIVIVIVAWWLGGWLGRRKLLQRRAASQPFLAELLRQTIRLGALLVGLLVALDLLNATALLGALLGTAGILGIAFGFAFRDVAENYIAGVLLSIRQPFLPNDHVVVDGHEGRVASLNSRATILLTPEGNHLRLPNAQVFKGVILNYTRNPARRFVFTLAVGNDEDLTAVRDLGLETLRGMPGVLDDPAPNVLIEAAGDSSMTLVLSAWIDQRDSDHAKVRSEAIRLVKAAYDQAGVAMPDPGFRVEVRRPGSTDRGIEPRQSTPAPAQGDVSPDDPIRQTVERERASRSEPDRLDPSAPRE